MKKKMTVLVALLMAFSIVGTCFAAESSFNIKFVDSNSWTPIVNARKGTATTYGEIKVSKMYDANQVEKSTYKRVKAKASPNGTQVTAVKGEWCNVPIPESYQTIGDLVPLYCMGNDPSLDCYITGFWNAH